MSEYDDRPILMMHEHHPEREIVFLPKGATIMPNSWLGSLLHAREHHTPPWESKNEMDTQELQRLRELLAKAVDLVECAVDEAMYKDDAACSLYISDAEQWLKEVRAELPKESE